jgi:hypothetical protein
MLPDQGGDMLKRIASVVVLLLSAASAEAVEVTSFLLVNGTEYEIRGLSLSQANLGIWGPNVLSPPYIRPGQGRQVSFPGVFVSCNVDLKVVFANNDDQPVWQYLNICNLRKIKLRYDAMSRIPTASYDD